jgi:hypothetical protein
MAHTILYVREYPFDSPKLEGITLLTAQTPSEAMRIMDENEDSIDGYILGMVMVRDGVSIEDVDEKYRQYRDLASRIETDDWSIETGKLIFQRRQLFEEWNELLDYTGGKKVFQHLKDKKKPILWLTSQYGVNDHVRRDIKNSVEVVNMRDKTKSILDWLSRKIE